MTTMLPICRRRLDLNCEQWLQLLKTLSQLSDWLVKLNEEIRRQQPLGGDLISLKVQNEELQVGFTLFIALLRPTSYLY